MIKKYTNIEMPGAVLDASPYKARINNTSTKLFISCCEGYKVRKKIEELYGENWWESEEAGKYLRRMMKDGANINLQEFSKLDSRVFLRDHSIANYLQYFSN